MKVCNYLFFLPFIAVFDIGGTEVFKCTIEGKVVIQGHECPTGANQEIMKVEDSVKETPLPPWSMKYYDPAMFSDRDNQLIKDKKVAVGMTKMALLFSWGPPDKINRSAYGPEQWIYRNGYDAQYVYVKDDIVVNWSE
ncbi:hypothetical protein [Shewanella algae]|uniref:hypothetical protein n=1 Tax=Shewanella algae TaxID=38313 RepID=UPI001AAD4861|nr:hypothetical protein [Shewanella algae]MBO2684962.1 hypothetical protein [Shewanella algae]